MPFQRLRPDISIVRVKDTEEEKYLVEDHASGDAYEFGPEEHFLLTLLDGSRAADEILAAFEEKFGPGLEKDSLERFLAMLEEWGLLEDVPAEEADDAPVDVDFSEADIDDFLDDLDEPAPLPPQRPAPGPFAGAGMGMGAGAAPGGGFTPLIKKPDRFHYSLGKPDRFFLACGRFLHPLRFGVYLLPLLLLAGVLTASNNWDALEKDLGRFWHSISYIQHLFLSLITVNLVGELLKGAVCRYEGAATPSFGFRMVLWVVPRFETVISGVEQLGKRQQLWIHATPLIIRLAFFGLGLVLWSMTRYTGTQLPALGLMTSLVSLASLIEIGNPLFGGPAYGLLSVSLDMPNLKEQANRALFRRFSSDAKKYGSASAGDDRALLAYAVASMLFMVLMVGVIFFVVARALEANYQGTGVALALIWLGYLFWRLKKNSDQRQKQLEQLKEKKRQAGAMGGMAAAGGFGQQGGPWGGMGMRGGGMGMGMRGGGMGMRGGMQPPAEEEEMEEEVELSFNQRLWRFGAWVLVIIVLLLPYPYETGGAATVLTVKHQEIHPEREGILTKVYFKGGEWVTQGTLLAEMESHDQLKNVEVTQASLAKAEAELQRLLTTPTPEQVALAQQELATAKTQALFSREQMQRNQRLVDVGFISVEKFDSLRRQSDVDDSVVVQKQKSLEAVLASVHPQDIAAKQAEIEKLKGELNYYRGELERTKLVAPFDGRLVTMNLDYMIGMYMKDASLFSVIEDDRVVPVQLDVPESDAGELAIGRKARIKVWAYPGREFEGTVSEISPAVSTTESSKALQVKCLVPNQDGVLRSGMTGYGKVEGRTMTVIEAFTRMIVRFVLIESWSWLP